MNKSSKSRESIMMALALELLLECSFTSLSRSLEKSLLLLYFFLVSVL